MPHIPRYIDQCGPGLIDVLQLHLGFAAQSESMFQIHQLLRQLFLPLHHRPWLPLGLMARRRRRRLLPLLLRLPQLAPLGRAVGPYIAPCSGRLEGLADGFYIIPIPFIIYTIYTIIYI